MPFVIIIVAGVSLGALAWRALRLPDDDLDAWTYRTLIGLAGCGLLAIALGWYSLRLAQSVLALAALAGLAAEIHFRSRSKKTAPVPHADDAPYSLLEKACVGTVAVALFLTLLSALAPVTNWDAAVAHLAVPADYARIGRITPLPGNVYSGYPQLMHALFAVAFYDAGEKPVVLLNWAFAALACAAVFCLGRRIGGRRCAWIAAAIMASAPIFMDQAGGVSIDLAFAAFSTAALSALTAWRDERKTGWLIVAAWLAGCACGVRHTGYLTGALLLLAVGVGARDRRVHSLALFITVAGLAAAPWLIRSAWVTGNPVFPFLLNWFPSSTFDHVAITGLGVHETIAKTGGMSWYAFFRFPYDLIIHPDRFDGWAKSPGGLVLILGVPGLLLGGWRAWSLGAYSIAGGMCFFFFQRFARYILPFFTPMMVVAALAESKLPALRKLITLVLLISFAYGLVLHAAAMHFKIPALLGRQTREEYLTARVERYPAFQWANENLNDGHVVLSIDQRTYFLQLPAYQNHWGLQRLAALPLPKQIQWLKDQKIKYLILPLDFLAESGALRDSIGPMIGQWRNSPQYFQRIKEFHFTGREKNRLESVEIYKVVDAPEDLTRQEAPPSPEPHPINTNETQGK